MSFFFFPFFLVLGTGIEQRDLMIPGKFRDNTHYFFFLFTNSFIPSISFFYLIFLLDDCFLAIEENLIISSPVKMEMNLQIFFFTMIVHLEG